MRGRRVHAPIHRESGVRGATPTPRASGNTQQKRGSLQAFQRLETEGSAPPSAAGAPR